MANTIVLNYERSIRAKVETAGESGIFTAHYADATSISFLEAATEGAITDTYANIVAPAANDGVTRRIVKNLTVYNDSSVSNTYYLAIYNTTSSQTRVFAKFSLAPGEYWALGEKGSGAAGVISSADIADGAITYAKIQDVSATDKVLGRSTAGSGDVEEITFTAAARALADDANAAAMATTLGLGTGDSPQFTAVNIGHASDTTLSRASAGVIAVEGVNVLLNGGALGTPSSGTLTNATGLPVAGITSSTSTALGVGSLEIGHASDTTLARVSAGVASIEGVTIGTASNTLTLTNKTLTSPIINSATGIGQIVVKYKAADETVNNSATLQDDDDLVLAVNSGEVWWVQVNAIVNSPSTTSDFKWAFTYPAVNAAYYGAYNSVSTGMTGLQAQGTGSSPIAPATASGTAVAAGSINGNYGIGAALLIAPSASGNVVWQWAQNTATAENTTVKKYSVMLATRIA